MMPKPNFRRAAFARNVDTLAWSVCAGAVMITMFMFVLGISGNDASATQPQPGFSATAPVKHSKGGREWDANDDRPAPSNVELPVIY